MTGGSGEMGYMHVGCLSKANDVENWNSTIKRGVVEKGGKF